LLETLARLGLSPKADKKYTTTPESKPIEPVCFEVPSNYEITVYGKKIIGSAQARRNGGVLQHGALPLQGDITRINWVLKYSDENTRQQASERLLQKATTVESILNQTIEWKDAAVIFKNAFADTFSIQFCESELSESEKTRANQLTQSRYAANEWTMRI
jgi:lipoate-protein ligase A